MRVALIGLGEAGSHIHLPALATMASVSVTGACDLDADRRSHVAATYRVPVFADAAAMLADCTPDVVIIGTPPDSHGDYCLHALRAGAHVVCEKPFVTSLAEADAVIDTARRAGRQIAVNHEFREMPIFRSLLDASAGPTAGDLRFVQIWQLIDLPQGREVRWRRQMTHRSLFEAGVHLVDFAMAIFGEHPLSVQAAVSGADSHAIDTIAVVTLEFSGGRLAQITQHRLCKGERQYFEVRADTTIASYRASFGGRARVMAGLFRNTRPQVRLEFGRSGLAWKEENGQRTILARNPKAPTIDATRRVFELSFEAFQTGGEPPTSGDRARRVLQVIVAAYHSARTGHRLRLDDPMVAELVGQQLGPMTDAGEPQP